MNNTLRSLCTAALCASALWLAGCSTTITSAALTPEQVKPAKPHPQSVSVAVTGGLETNPSASLKINDSTVADALVASIEKGKVFSRAIKGAGGDYKLTVALISGEYPTFGLTFTVKSEMAWSLTKADGTPVWRETIRTEGTATTSDAFAGLERVRMAAERSMRENIAQGLAKIGRLDF